MSWTKTKIILISFFMLASSCGVSFALSLSDDGAAWNSADYDAKFQLCKEIAQDSITQKDYKWWVEAFDRFYTDASEVVLKMKIKEAVLLVPFFDINGLNSSESR